MFEEIIIFILDCLKLFLIGLIAGLFISLYIRLMFFLKKRKEKVESEINSDKSLNNKVKNIFSKKE